MTKPTSQSKDIFSVCKKSVEKFFTEVEKSTPPFQQVTTKLQQDYIEAWKNVINSAIALEEEYATKAGLKTDVPEDVLKIIRDITEQAVQAYKAQNKIVMDVNEATKQAFSAFNENTKSFASLNRNIMGFMMSVFEKKSKT